MKYNKANTCSEEYKKMDKVASGIRHCDVCQKNVHDFRHKSVLWIADYIEKNGRPCAVYFEDQIDELNALHVSKEQKHFSLLKAAAVTSLITVGTMGAQASVLAPIHDYNEIIKPSNEEIIEISVTDKEGKVLADKKVKLIIDKENTIDLTTDATGKISYKIPSGLSFKSYSVQLVETGEVMTYKINISPDQKYSHCVKFESKQALAVVAMKKIQGRVEWSNNKKSIAETNVVLFLRTDSTDVEIGTAITDSKGNFSFEVRADQVQIGKTYVSTISSNGEDTKFIEAKHVDSKSSKVILKVTRRVRRSMGGAMAF